MCKKKEKNPSKENRECVCVFKLFFKQEQKKTNLHKTEPYIILDLCPHPLSQTINPKIVTPYLNCPNLEPKL